MPDHRMTHFQSGTQCTNVSTITTKNDTKFIVIVNAVIDAIFAGNETSHTGIDTVC